MKTIEDVLKETIPNAINSIFEGSSVNMNGVDQDDARYDVVAVIGFSRQYKGALGFSAEKSLVRTAYGECDTLLADSWVGEVANQPGTIEKSTFLSYGIEIQMALPMVLNGV